MVYVVCMQSQSNTASHEHNFGVSHVCIIHAIITMIVVIYARHCTSGITVHFELCSIIFTSIFCPLGMYPLQMRSQSSAMCFFSFWHSAGISRLLLGGTACSLLDLDRVVLKRWVTAASTCSSQPCVHRTMWIIVYDNIVAVIMSRMHMYMYILKVLLPNQYDIP